MNGNLFSVILEDKCSVFLRTEGKIYDVTECQDVSTFIDSDQGINLSGVLFDAKLVTHKYLVDLLSKGIYRVFKNRNRRFNGRATSKSRAIGRPIREEAHN